MRARYPKIWIGPMSKNIVDVVLEFEGRIGLIPSRRQVDVDGGYVNHWNTRGFYRDVKTKNKNVLIERDHGGIAQGQKFDGGYRSLADDANFFDLIHLDPWKFYDDIYEGSEQTVLYMKMCDRFGKVHYEIGTEEAIRKFEFHNIMDIIYYIRRRYDRFDEKVAYVVVQSGTGLDLAEQRNTGNFNESRLESMVDVCRHYGLMSKEHNGDYLTLDEIGRRFELGLDAINIAPEIGQLETSCYMEEMDLDVLYRLCYRSDRWKKWWNKDHEPSKEEVVKMCGHYLLSGYSFLSIKPDIDDKIKTVVRRRLKELDELQRDFGF